VFSLLASYNLAVPTGFSCLSRIVVVIFKNIYTKKSTTFAFFNNLHAPSVIYGPRTSLHRVLCIRGRVMLPFPAY